jgi:hypothetical protein
MSTTFVHNENIKSGYHKSINHENEHKTQEDFIKSLEDVNDSHNIVSFLHYCETGDIQKAENILHRLSNWKILIKNNIALLKAIKYNQIDMVTFILSNLYHQTGYNFSPNYLDESFEYDVVLNDIEIDKALNDKLASIDVCLGCDTPLNTECDKNCPYFQVWKNSPGLPL